MSGFSVADHLLVPSLPRASLVDLNNDSTPAKVDLLKKFKTSADTNPDVVSNFANRLLKGDDAYTEALSIATTFHSSSYARAVVKNNSRDANPFMHEWFPCNTWHLQLKWDLTAIEQKLAARPVWQSLHQIMRTPTRGVIFDPKVSCRRVTVLDAKKCSHFSVAEVGTGGVNVRPVRDGDVLVMPQGHPGGIKGGHTAVDHPGTTMGTRSGRSVAPSTTYGRTWQTLGSDDFHDQCFGTMIGSAVYFLSQPERYLQMFEAIQGRLQKVFSAWCWDGRVSATTLFLLPFEGWYAHSDLGRTPLLVDDADSFVRWQRQLIDDHTATALKIGQIGHLARSLITNSPMTTGVKFF